MKQYTETFDLFSKLNTYAGHSVFDIHGDNWCSALFIFRGNYTNCLLQLIAISCLAA